MPYEDSAFALRSDADEATQPGVDSPEISFRLTDREHAFWDKFAKTHPSPPDVIADEQRLSANQMLGLWYGFEHEGNPARWTKAELEDSDRVMSGRSQALGYPPEAFTHDALHWVYALEKRAEYERDYPPARRKDSSSSTSFLARLLVDSKLITEPLSDAQTKSANAWKIAYLQRLRGEKTDESYINAYLQAWNLSTDTVFGGTNNP